MLAGGQALSASQVASALKRDFDGVSKHLRLLRAAGVVASRPGEDQRFELYYIPAAYRPQPGVVDYGFCLLRFATG
jgi:predicted transcriptional regulator